MHRWLLIIVLIALGSMGCTASVNKSSVNFTSESARSGASIFGVGGGDSAFAASSLGQASRAALNHAVRQIDARLTSSGFSPER